jgi:hypothetical protein
MNEDEQYYEDALDQLMLLFDALFRTERFSEANQLLIDFRVDDEEIQPVILIGMVSATCCAKKHLAFYETFLNNVRLELLERMNDPVRVNSLLKGF